MKLQKIHHRTESILNIIASITKKEIQKGDVLSAKFGVCIQQSYLARELKCNIRTIGRHLQKLKEEGILTITRKDVYGLCSYSINETALYSETFESCFNEYIVTKCRTIFNINNKSNSIKERKSERKCGSGNHIFLNSKEFVFSKDMVSIPRLKQKRSKTKNIEADIPKETLGKVVVSNTSPENEKPTTIQDMMRKWNEVLGRQDALTQHISRYLLASYQRKFGNSIEKWEEYLNLLKNSEYVTQKMPTMVKSLILWALRFKVIDRILMGGFGVVKNFIEECYEKDRERIIEEIKNSYEEDVCKSIRRRVLSYLEFLITSLSCVKSS
jgi:DNA-binding transcriptional regulator YhcF (GntR family)